MKPSGFAVRNQVRGMVARKGEGFRENRRKSQEIKVVEDQEHGQNDIDNHSSQNYNVEHF